METQDGLDGWFELLGLDTRGATHGFAATQKPFGAAYPGFRS